TGPPHQLVGDALATPVGVLSLQQHDRRADVRGHATPARPATGLVHQSCRAAFVEALLPGVERVLGDADQTREVSSGQTAPLPQIEQLQALLRRRVPGLPVRYRSHRGPDALPTG